MTDRILAVIPARAGSKRVPEKNLKEVGGKPLIAHAIEDVGVSSSVDEAIVSTEDEEIRSVAEQHGGEVPFERPAALATDTATNDEVVAHAVEWFQERGEEFDVVALVPPTTPFRSPTDVTSAVERLRECDAHSVVSVTEYEAPPHWALDESGDYLEPYFGRNYLWGKTRSQEMPTLRHPNGAVKAASVPAFLETESFYTDRTVAYEMPRERSLDVDEPFDLELCRALAEYRA